MIMKILEIIIPIFIIPIIILRRELMEIIYDVFDVIMGLFDSSADDPNVGL